MALVLHSDLRKLAIFCVVGAANTGVTLAVIFVLRHFGIAVWTASVAGYLVGMVQGYLLNRFWTFGGDHALPAGAQIAAFVAVNLACSVVFGWLNTWLDASMPLLAASLLASALIALPSFALNRWVVFRARVTPHDDNAAGAIDSR